jgi:hypothetical protein
MKQCISKTVVFETSNCSHITHNIKKSNSRESVLYTDLLSAIIILEAYWDERGGIGKGEETLWHRGNGDLPNPKGKTSQ